MVTLATLLRMAMPCPMQSQQREKQNQRWNIPMAHRHRYLSCLGTCE